MRQRGLHHFAALVHEGRHADVLRGVRPTGSWPSGRGRARKSSFATSLPAVRLRLPRHLLTLAAALAAPGGVHEKACFYP